MKIPRALEMAKWRLRCLRDNAKEPSGEDLVFATLKLAADIKRRNKRPAEGERRPVAHDLSMADDVFELWRRHLTGDKRDRDWKILLGLASGGNVRDIGAEFGLSKSMVSQIKQLQCRHIWPNIVRFMPNLDPIAMALKLGESLAAESARNSE